MFAMERMSNKRKSDNFYFGALESNKFERSSFCRGQFRINIMVKKYRTFITLFVRTFI